MVPFVKMEGLGNDFVVVSGEVELDEPVIRLMCDRRFGVGADGVLRVSLDGEAVRMEYWNADGTTAEMCGNGLRCVARFARDSKLVEADEFEVMTPVGWRRTRRLGPDRIGVDLGPVTLGATVTIDDREYRLASVGNPHAVTFVEDPDETDVRRVGTRVAGDISLFPEGVNVEFVRAVAPSTIQLRVWERGVGETLACGTGIVAAAAAAVSTGEVTGPDVEVRVPGGVAVARITDQAAWLEGPARYVFEGAFDPR